MCPAVCRPGLFRTPHCSTSPSAPGPAQSQRANVSTRNFQFQLAVGRNPRTGTFCASKGELRTSYNILQWTYRYSIPLCRSRAPSASMTLPVAMSRSQASLSWIHTDDAGKGPRSSTYSKASEFSSEEICWRFLDHFSSGCQICAFHVREFRPGSFALQRSCSAAAPNPFSPLSSAR